MSAKKVIQALKEYEAKAEGQNSTDQDPYDYKNDPYDDAEGKRPEPWRNTKGASILGPRNIAREMQSPDMVHPPETDKGTMPNMKWSFADSHMRIEVSSHDELAR